MAGFIKLHRKLLKWGWYTDPNTFRVFMHILLTASYEENEFRGRIIKPGQAVIGRKQLAKDLKISEQSVRTALEHLKSTNEITTESTNQYTIVTVENWAKYQVLDSEINQQIDQQINQQSTNNQPTTNHTQEGKESKKVRNKNNIYTPEIEEIVGYLNELTGQHYRPTTKKTIDLIEKWLKLDFTVEDFKTVIYKKTKEWGNNPKMVGFLRPETLFGNKFEGYLNQVDVAQDTGRSFLEVEF